MYDMSQRCTTVLMKKSMAVNYTKKSVAVNYSMSNWIHEFVFYIDLKTKMYIHNAD